jgi:hypothetical protein
MAPKTKPNYTGLSKPLPVLLTPKGSTMKAGSNSNAWENVQPYTADQTAMGYGAVPPMTMNIPKTVNTEVMNSTVAVPTQMQQTPVVSSGLATSQQGTGIWDSISNGASNMFGSAATPASYVYNPETKAQEYVPGTAATGMGGMQGLMGAAPLVTGLASAYNGYQQNKLLDRQVDMQNAENERQVRKEKDFATNMNKSGLGTYSAGA